MIVVTIFHALLWIDRRRMEYVQKQSAVQESIDGKPSINMRIDVLEKKITALEDLLGKARGRSSDQADKVTKMAYELRERMMTVETTLRERESQTRDIWAAIHARRSKNLQVSENNR